MSSFGSRLKHAWNAFVNPIFDLQQTGYSGNVGYGGRPDRNRLSFTSERSIISSIYTRMSIDVAAISMAHIRTDEDGRYSEEIRSGLNRCLTLEANLDQSAREFRQDIAMTLFDKGVAAIVPVDASENPNVYGNFDVKTMRVGEVLAWHPQHVKLSVYNEQKGYREQITMSKRSVAIVTNPLYNVMNEPNSTLQRLIRKLNLLDAVDEQTGSGKLDLIIQLPYTIRSEARRQQADQRRKDIEFQLRGSKYGIAYTDGTEKITQLNRPVDNNLLKQVDTLTEMLYSQLGLTTEVMAGTADEKTMLNYYNRTVEPIIGAIVEAMRRTFLTNTARTQGQSIWSFRDPFRLVPVNDIAEIADKFTRNEILTANEIRSLIGYKPSQHPKADELRNSNMPQTDQPPSDNNNDAMISDLLAGLNSDIDQILQPAGDQSEQA